MKKVVFLYSGEGTKGVESSLKLVQTSSYWSDIDEIIQSKFDVSIEEIWQHDAIHQCPYSPLLTVTTQICLSDVWKRWGYEPTVVIGHSSGELAAAYQAGLYTLEEILLLAYEIGKVAGKLDGTMFHGTLSDKQIDQLNVSLSSCNFMVGDQKHVTVSCLPDEKSDFHQLYPEFLEMKPPHPWHHWSYCDFTGPLTAASSRKNSGPLFVSGVTAQFESELQGDHWQKWLTGSIDLISAMKAIANRFPDNELEIIEIGFHPVLEKCCEIFTSYQYASSMYRGGG